MQGDKIRVKRDKTPQEALETARWLCAKMERTTSDIRLSLYRWGVREVEAQDRIITTLVAEKFIDHERYAGAYVREKLSAGRWGVAKISASLRTKGIEREIVERALDENVSMDDLVENLERMLIKLRDAETTKAKNAFDLRSRLFRRAASRGYDFDDINAILDKILYA